MNLEPLILFQGLLEICYFLVGFCRFFSTEYYDESGQVKPPLYLLSQFFPSNAQRNHGGMKCLAVFKTQLLFMIPPCVVLTHPIKPKQRKTAVL